MGTTTHKNVIHEYLSTEIPALKSVAGDALLNALLYEVKTTIGKVNKLQTSDPKFFDTKKYKVLYNELDIVPVSIKKYFSYENYVQSFYTYGEYTICINMYECRDAVPQAQRTDMSNAFSKFLFWTLFSWLFFTNAVSEASKASAMRGAHEAGLPKHIIVHYFPTSLQKVLPEDQCSLLSFNEVNGGYSWKEGEGGARNARDTGKVVIYREEEALKIIIHEFIHLSDMDIHVNSNEALKKELRKQGVKFLNVEESQRPAETYVELIAEIINVAVYTQGERIRFYKYLDIERKFSILQTAKLLDYCSYVDFTVFNEGKGSKKIPQRTNAVNYHITKAALFFSLGEVLEFFIRHANEAKEGGTFVEIMTYKKEYDTDYKELVAKCLKNEEFREMINDSIKTLPKGDAKIMKTLRMSIVDGMA